MVWRAIAEPADADMPAAADPEPAPAAPAETAPEESSTEAGPAAELPKKKVDFEITNPDDIDMDNNGQLGLF